MGIKWYVTSRNYCATGATCELMFMDVKTKKWYEIRRRGIKIRVYRRKKPENPVMILDSVTNWVYQNLPKIQSSRGWKKTEFGTRITL